jgi:hypothetical protein
MRNRRTASASDRRKAPKNDTLFLICRGELLRGRTRDDRSRPLTRL